MKYLILLMISAILFFCNFHHTFSQEEYPATPIKPGYLIYPIKIEVFGGINLPVSPSELVNKPTTATREVQKSLLNGFNGLGFAQTFNFGIVAFYPLNDKIYLGMGIDYSKWESINSCNCNDTLGMSVNSLTMLDFAFIAQYFLYDKLYSKTELGLNILGAKVIENSNRGNLDFTKSYPRIGAGLGIGYEIWIIDKLSLDISAYGLFPNLILGKENNGNSESLINSKGEKNEANLIIISFKVGLLYSL